MIINEPEPDQSKMPTNKELLAARLTLKRLSSAIYFNTFDPDVWGGVVEARRMLTIAIDYLAGFDKKYRLLWKQMLEQDG